MLPESSPSYLYPFGLLALALVLFFIIWPYCRNTLLSQAVPTSTLPAAEKNPYEDIEPLVHFNWKTTPPIRNAPLKPKYHLTMALETIPLSSLLEIDSTHLARLAIRTSLLQTHPEATIQCLPSSSPAVYELYSWIFATYLPRRFPTLYHLHPSGTGLVDTTTATTIPLSPLPATPHAALRMLGETVDTDFLLLLPAPESPDPSSPQQPTYHLTAFVTCFPTGFSTREKLGLPLAQIHAPVPWYKARLERSMDRFFARLETGKCVKRGNWSLTTNAELFAETGNHLYADGRTETNVREETKVGGESENLDAEIERQKREVVIKECRLRSERQTLFRLPMSRALVFSFKTYQYTLEEVKREGYAEQLAEAMEGLRQGNVPEMDFYKRGVVWREPVVQYLRS